MTDILARLRQQDEAEVKDLNQTIIEVCSFHKKHIFDENQSIALGYEESIQLIKDKITEIKGRWITSTT